MAAIAQDYRQSLISATRNFSDWLKNTPDAKRNWKNLEINRISAPKTWLLKSP